MLSRTVLQTTLSKSTTSSASVSSASSAATLQQRIRTITQPNSFLCVSKCLNDTTSFAAETTKSCSALPHKEEQSTISIPYWNQSTESTRKVYPHNILPQHLQYWKQGPLTPALPQPTTPSGNSHLTNRQFSSKGGRGEGRHGNNNNRNKRKGRNTSQAPLINEELILAVLQNDPDQNANASTTVVRLVTDQGRDNPSKISVLSLAEAIETSTELSVDLVGIALDQKPPVIKAIDYNKLLYDQNKKSSNSGGGGGSGGSKTTKEFTFKAGIADNDLQRKAENMVSYLQKGHSCQVVITSNGRSLREDSNAVVTTLDRVKELVGEVGVQQATMKKNAGGSRGTLLFQPNLKK